MARALRPEEVTVLIAREGLGETLSADDAAALAAFRDKTLADLRRFREAFAGVTEEEVLAAFFEDERLERARAQAEKPRKLSPRARKRSPSPSSRP